MTPEVRIYQYQATHREAQFGFLTVPELLHNTCKDCGMDCGEQERCEDCCRELGETVG